MTSHSRSVNSLDLGRTMEQKRLKFGFSNLVLGIYSPVQLRGKAKRDDFVSPANRTIRFATLVKVGRGRYNFLHRSWHPQNHSLTETDWIMAKKKIDWSYHRNG